MSEFNIWQLGQQSRSRGLVALFQFCMGAGKLLDKMSLPSQLRGACVASFEVRCDLVRLVGVIGKTQCKSGYLFIIKAFHSFSLSATLGCICLVNRATAR